MAEKNKELGVMWITKTKSGRLVLKGRLTINGTSYRIICFKNEKEPTSKRPDWVIYEMYSPESQT